MRKIDIEALLVWTYCSELPKAPPEPRQGFLNPWNMAVGFGELLSGVDGPELRNRYGVVPDLFAKQWPHQDAWAVWEAVAGLDAMELVLPDDWNPILDMGDFGALGLEARRRAIDKLTTIDREGRRRLRQTPRRLIERNAILRAVPDWQEFGEPIQVREVTAHGKPRWFRRKRVWSDGAFGRVYETIEVDGFNEKARRPYPDAYRKHFLDPDPAPLAVARAEYEVWHAALGVLVEDLQGALTEHEVTMTPRAARPWEAGAAVPAGRILPDLTNRGANLGVIQIARTAKKTAKHEPLACDSHLT